MSSDGRDRFDLDLGTERELRDGDGGASRLANLGGDATGARRSFFDGLLTVALATSNSFIIPTHQVNALIMGPGGYRVADFMKAGGIMTVLFLVVTMLMMVLSPSRS